MYNLILNIYHVRLLSFIIVFGKLCFYSYTQDRVYLKIEIRDIYEEEDVELEQQLRSSAMKSSIFEKVNTLIHLIKKNHKRKFIG